MQIVLDRGGHDPLAPTRLKYHVKSSSFAKRSGGRLHVGLHPAAFLKATCASLCVVGQHTGTEREIGGRTGDELVALAAKTQIAEVRVSDVDLACMLWQLSNRASCHGD